MLYEIQNNLQSQKTSMERMVAFGRVSNSVMTTTASILTHMEHPLSELTEQKDIVVDTKPNLEEKNASRLAVSSIPSAKQQQNSAYLAALPSMPGVGSLELLQKVILNHNEALAISYHEGFVPLGADGLVVIIQVHKREKYLKFLLKSLKEAKGIENVLLVISHDYYYDDMNEIVRSIDFCQVSE